MKLSTPPKLAEALLEKVLPEQLKEPLLGDLEEEFHHIRITRSEQSCRLWYWRQAFITSFHYANQTQKALIMFVVSVVLFAALTLFAMELSGGIAMFVDLPSIIITLPPALAFTIAVTSVADFKQAFGSLLSGHVDSLRQVNSSVKVFEVLGNTSLWLGGLMTLLGWVSMGSYIKEVEVIGPAFAVSILTFIYAMGIKVVCYVAGQRLAHLGDTLASANQ